MTCALTLLDLRLRRRSLIGYTLGTSVYTLIIVALYPSFKDDKSLNQLTAHGNAVAALFGANGPLTTPTGWLNANLYANFVPLIALLLAIGYGAACVAGQDEDGPLGLLATLPVTRRRIIVQKTVAMCLQAAPVTAATAIFVLIGRSFDLPTSAGGLAGVSVGTLLLALDFGALAVLVGAWTGSRGTALGITSALAAAAYLISSLAPVVDWLHPARYASPFYYALGNAQLSHGLSMTDASVLLAIAAILSAGTVAAFDHLDIH